MAGGLRPRWWPFLPFLRFPNWFNGHPLNFTNLPGPEQPSGGPSGFTPTGDRVGQAFTQLIPHLPPEAGFLGQVGQNHQVGAQPERQAATLAGHTVTGAYLLTGELPVGTGLKPRLTASTELLFHPHPLPHGGGALELGPVGPIVRTGGS